MAFTHQPVTVWYGDTQLTGSEPYGFYRIAADDPRRENPVQKTFFGTVLTATPAHITPKRRYQSVYVPGRDGSKILYDDGYNDTTQTYEFAIDMTPEQTRARNLRKLRAFADALTGRTPNGSFDSSDARWDWLIDTYDNYMETAMTYGPHPALNCVSAGLTRTTSYTSPWAYKWARLATYDGGDDIINECSRTGRMVVPFRVKPVLYRIEQAYVKDPALVPAGYDTSAQRSYDAHYTIGPLAKAYAQPIVRLYWDGNAEIRRLDDTQPITIRCANNIFGDDAGHISIDAYFLSQNAYGGYGIGWDMVTDRVITGDKSRVTDYSQLQAGGQNFYIFIDNADFNASDGHMYISVEYVAATRIC